MGKKTKQDPTGQARNRRTASRRLKNRCTRAEKRVRAILQDIPRKRRTVTPLVNRKVIPVYDYQLTADELEQVNRGVRRVINDELVETQLDRMPPNWWWQSVLEPPYREGSAEEVIQFNQLISSEVVRARKIAGLTPQRLEVQAVLMSQEYQDALNKVYVRNFDGIRTLSDRTSDQVIQTINAGLSAKESPRTIAKNIGERFDVSRSSAKRIADTEVNWAYNDARLDAVDVAAGISGLRAGTLHLSALIPTTRSNHANRHGNAYTTAQQRQWWATGANRINCHCSTRSVLIDKKGKVIDIELQQEIKAERSFFDPEPPATPPATPPASPPARRRERKAPPATLGDQFAASGITDPRYRAALEDAGTPAVTQKKDGAYFSPGSKAINMPKKYVPGGNPGDATYRHEYGHYYDDHKGTITATSSYNAAVHAADRAIKNRDKKFYNAHKSDVGGKAPAYSKRSVSIVWLNKVREVSLEAKADGRAALDWAADATTPGGLARGLVDKLKEAPRGGQVRLETVAEIVAAERFNRPLGYVSALWDGGAGYYLQETWREAGHVTDLVGSITNLRHGGGHSAKYYRDFKRGPIRFGQNLEAYAQVFSLNAIDAGPLGNAFVQEFAPNLVEILKEQME